MLDLLTYAGTLTNLAPVLDSPRLRFVEGDIRDAALVGAAMAGIDAWCTSPPRPRRPVDRAARPTSSRRTCWAPRCCCRPRSTPGWGGSCTCPPTRSTARSPHGSWPETHPLEPNSPYSASKASSDLLARAYHRTHGLPVCITRCSNNYGPHQFPEKVIPLFVTNLLDGAPVPLYGDGLNVRDWLHVDDHCRGIQLVLARRAAGRGLQHRRRHRADEPRADPPAARRGRRGRVDGSSRWPTARATTGATRSTGPRSPTELGYAPQVPFEQGLAGDGGVVPGATATGGSRSRPGRRPDEGARAGDRRRVGVRAARSSRTRGECSPRRSRGRRSGRRWASTSPSRRPTTASPRAG